MAIDILGQVAVVTGASSGIGRASALRLAESGCRLALSGRNIERLAAVEAECRGLGVMARSYPADVTDKDAVEAAVGQIVADYGSINILVYAAGVYSLARPEEQEFADSAAMLDVNLRGAMYWTRFCLPQIIAGCEGSTGRGALIYIASMSGKRTYGGASAYCASKFGVVGYASGVWDDVRAHNIKVCSICPGYVDTPMTADVDLPREQMIQPEDVAELAALIAAWPDSSCPNEMQLNMQQSAATLGRGLAP